jgi:hypothetical protein
MERFRMRDLPVLAEGTVHGAVPKSHRKAIGAGQETGERFFFYRIYGKGGDHAEKGYLHAAVYIRSRAAMPDLSFLKHASAGAEQALDCAFRKSLPIEGWRAGHFGSSRAAFRGDSR